MKNIVGKIKKIYTKPLLLGLLFLGIFFGIRFAGLHNLVTLDNLHSHRHIFALAVQDHYWSSVACYILIYMIGVALSLPIALLFTVSGGFFFGVLPGALFANIGATLGAMISFFFVRYSVGEVIQLQYATRLVHFNKMIELHGVRYLLLIHLVAFVPFSMVNVLAGLTRVHWWTFAWTTLVGIIPTSLLYTYAGRRLAEINSIAEIFTPEIVVGMVGIACFAAILLYFSRIFLSRNDQ